MHQVKLQRLKKEEYFKDHKRNIYSCGLCQATYFSKHRYNQHRRQKHQAVIPLGRPANLQKPKVEQPVEVRQLRYALTGNTEFVRPFLKLLLQSKGAKVTNYPSKSTDALICGTSHVPAREVSTYLKYKVAVKNQVPIVAMADLPAILGCKTGAEFTAAVDNITKELLWKRLGPG